MGIKGLDTVVVFGLVLNNFPLLAQLDDNGAGVRVRCVLAIPELPPLLSLHMCYLFL